jgi:hypothetical protein
VAQALGSFGHDRDNAGRLRALLDEPPLDGPPPLAARPSTGSAAPLLKLSAVAAHFGIEMRTAYSWVAAGKLRVLRLGELLGLEATRGFHGQFTTDHVQGGLIVADILAGAKSRVLRRDDPDGRWGRFLDALQLKPGERSLLPPVFRVPGRILHDVPRLG